MRGDVAIWTSSEVTKYTELTFGAVGLYLLTWQGEKIGTLGSITSTPDSRHWKALRVSSSQMVNPPTYSSLRLRGEWL